MRGTRVGKAALLLALLFFLEQPEPVEQRQASPQRRNRRLRRRGADVLAIVDALLTLELLGLRRQGLKLEALVGLGAAPTLAQHVLQALDIAAQLVHDAFARAVVRRVVAAR